MFRFVFAAYYATLDDDADREASGAVVRATRARAPHLVLVVDNAANPAPAPVERVLECKIDG